MTSPADIATEIELNGRFDASAFAAWICHRAALLDLRGWVQAEAPDRIRLLVAGPEALVDAMEMACHLGPGDSAVARIERQVAHGGDVPNGFQSRQPPSQGAPKKQASAKKRCITEYVRAPQAQRSLPKDQKTSKR